MEPMELATQFAQWARANVGTDVIWRPDTYDQIVLRAALRLLEARGFTVETGENEYTVILPKKP